MARRDAWYVADWSSKAGPKVGPDLLAGNAKKSAPAEEKDVRLPRQSTGGMENKLPPGANLRGDERLVHMAIGVDHVTVDPQADCLPQADE
jgi:hypothetical protein